MRIGEIELEIIDVITFTGVMITFVTGVLNLWQNKKSLYINNITRFRVMWISTLRGHIASLKELSNITNLYIITRNETNKIPYRRELEKVVSLIKMHLNFTGKYDIELISKVEKLKSTLNSYLLMHYCKNEIKLTNDDYELVKKFKVTVEAISEKQVLDQLLNLASYSKNINSKNLFELKKAVKLAYEDNPELIKQIVKESDYIISQYENEIDCLNSEIDMIVQIYLKAEWIRCKVETKIWPHNKYNQERVIQELEREYKNINEVNTKH